MPDTTYTLDDLSQFEKPGAPAGYTLDDLGQFEKPGSPEWVKWRNDRARQIADAATREPVDPGYIRGLLETGNPLPGLRDLLVGGGAGPLQGIQNLAENAVKGSQDQAQKAIDAWRRGDHFEAIGRAVASQIPILGPAAAKAGEDIGEGKPWEGLGEGTGLILASVLGPKAMEAAPDLARTAAETAPRAWDATQAFTKATLPAAPGAAVKALTGAAAGYIPVVGPLARDLGLISGGGDILRTAVQKGIPAAVEAWKGPEAAALQKEFDATAQSYGYKSFRDAPAYAQDTVRSAVARQAQLRADVAETLARSRAGAADATPVTTATGVTPEGEAEAPEAPEQSPEDTPEDTTDDYARARAEVLRRLRAAEAQAGAPSVTVSPYERAQGDVIDVAPEARPEAQASETGPARETTASREAPKESPEDAADRYARFIVHEGLTLSPENLAAAARDMGDAAAPTGETAAMIADRVETGRRARAHFEAGEPGDESAPAAAFWQQPEDAAAAAHEDAGTRETAARMRAAQDAQEANRQAKAGRIIDWLTDQKLEPTAPNIRTAARALIEDRYPTDTTLDIIRQRMNYTPTPEDLADAGATPSEVSDLAGARKKAEAQRKSDLADRYAEYLVKNDLTVSPASLRDAEASFAGAHKLPVNNRTQLPSKEITALIAERADALRRSRGVAEASGPQQ